MRSGSAVLTLVVVGISTLLCSAASAQNRSGGQVDVDVFYDELAPYGEWVEMPEYGWSFAPRVERGWRPYTRGHWVLTDDGWYWDSEEEFGWAAYHYGRWVDDPSYGWVWVPGTEWAPAWVSWRHGDGYTGWAPLPPRATWRTRFGLSLGGLEIDAFLGANDYVFVQDRSFVGRSVYQRVLPRERNRSILGRTRNVTNYSYANKRIVNRGVDSAILERAVGRRIERAQTVDVDRLEPSRRDRAGEISVFRPEVRASRGRRPAQGRSLVRGDKPSPLLVQRRAERTRERQQTGREAEVTARDAAQPRPGTADRKPATRTDAKAEAQDAARPRDRARRGADEERARSADQERQNRERSQVNTRKQQEQARQAAEEERGKRRRSQHLDQERSRPNEQEQSEQTGARRERNGQAQPGGSPKDTRKEANGRSQERGKRAPKTEPTPPAKEGREH